MVLFEREWLPSIMPAADDALRAAAKQGDIEAMRRAEAQGAVSYSAALIAAAAGGHVDCMTQAYQWGATNLGNAFAAAAQADHLEAAALLIVWGEERANYTWGPARIVWAITDGTPRPEVSALEHDRPEYFKLWHRFANIRISDSSGWILHAVKKKANKCLDYLLSIGGRNKWAELFRAAAICHRGGYRRELMQRARASAAWRLGDPIYCAAFAGSDLHGESWLNPEVLGDYVHWGVPVSHWFVNLVTVAGAGSAMAGTHYLPEVDESDLPQAIEHLHATGAVIDADFELALARTASIKRQTLRVLHLCSDKNIFSEQYRNRLLRDLDGQQGLGAQLLKWARQRAHRRTVDAAIAMWPLDIPLYLLRDICQLAYDFGGALSILEGRDAIMRVRDSIKALDRFVNTDES